MVFRDAPTTLSSMKILLIWSNEYVHNSFLCSYTEASKPYSGNLLHFLKSLKHDNIQISVLI